jgi:acyl-CoA thioester hydrolase
VDAADAAARLEECPVPRIFVREFQVPESSIDANRHVGNLEYLRWMQDIAIEHSAARGWPHERYLAERIAWVVRSHSIEYVRPAFLGETLALATWVADLRSRSSLRRYLVWRGSDRQVLVQAETRWVLVEGDSGRARAIPDELRASFEVVADTAEVLRRLDEGAATRPPAAGEPARG